MTASNPGTPALRPPSHVGVVVPVAAGVALGLLSFASDYLLRYPWSMVGNVTGTWVAVAFAVGALAGAGSRAHGALAAVLALVIATVTYYAAMTRVWAPDELHELLPGVLVWGVVAVLVGPLAGVAGAAWRSGRLGRHASWWVRPAAVAGVVALVASEASWLALTAPSPDGVVGALVELSAAALAPFVLLRSFRERLTAYAAAIVLGTVGLPLLAVVIPPLFRLAGSGRL